MAANEIFEHSQPRSQIEAHKKLLKSFSMRFDRGRFLRYFLLMVGVALSQVLVGFVIIILSPWRAMGVYVGFCLLCMLKIGASLASSLDILLNLVEARRDARRAVNVLTGLPEDSKWVERLVLGRGTYIPMTADQVLSEFFYGFPQGTFMVSYNWTHPELPRRIARELLPERPPAHPNKCWLDLEQLVPGRRIGPACEAAVKAARFVFVFLTEEYLNSTNCQIELKALLEKPDARKGALVFKYAAVEEGPSPRMAPERSVSVAAAFAEKSVRLQQRSATNIQAMWRGKRVRQHSKGAKRGAPADEEDLMSSALAEKSVAAALFNRPADVDVDVEIDIDVDTRNLSKSTAARAKERVTIQDASKEAVRAALEPTAAPTRAAVLNEELQARLGTLPVRRLPFEGSCTLGELKRSYDSSDLLSDLIRHGALANMFAYRSPRINAQWLATASALCEPRSCAGALGRFAHVVVVPVLLAMLYYFCAVFIASGSFAVGGLQSSLEANFIDDCPVGEASSPNASAIAVESTTSRTPQMIMAILSLGLLLEAALVAWVLLALPLIQRPRRSALQGLPDAGLLLLVLYKMGVLKQPVPVLDLSFDDAFTSGMELLQQHGVVRLVGHRPKADSAGAHELTEALAANGAPLLVFLDMDSCDAPPAGFSASGRKVQYVAWSVEQGFGKLESSSWSEVGSTLVAKPERASQMLEAALCRILATSLSSDDGVETELIAGGSFEVDFNTLSVHEHEHDHNKALHAAEHALKQSIHGIARFVGGHMSTKNLLHQHDGGAAEKSDTSAKPRKLRAVAFGQSAFVGSSKAQGGKPKQGGLEA